MTSEDLIEMNRRVVVALLNVASQTERPKALSPHLIFPELRTGNIRVSEQEARLLWCTMLQDTSYYYAIEAPTANTYIQSGTKPMSARTDLALYKLTASGFKRVANIEFKAHSSTPEQIKKDTEKLIREKITGNWFHLLSSANSATIPRLFEKFAAAFKACSSHVHNNIDIVFCICVLRNRQMLTRHFTYPHGQRDFVAYVNDFFSDPDTWKATLPGIGG